VSVVEAVIWDGDEVPGLVTKSGGDAYRACVVVVAGLIEELGAVAAGFG
jgi:hypothetical protein